MGTLLLAVTLILWGLSLLGLVAIGNVLLGIFALVTEIVLLVEGFGVVRVPFPGFRRDV